MFLVHNRPGPGILTTFLLYLTSTARDELTGPVIKVNTSPVGPLWKNPPGICIKISFSNTLKPTVFDLSPPNVIYYILCVPLNLSFPFFKGQF
jgi:hypothetical protein